jgi:hypothetical protein
MLRDYVALMKTKAMRGLLWGSSVSAEIELFINISEPGKFSESYLGVSC